MWPLPFSGESIITGCKASLWVLPCSSCQSSFALCKILEDSLRLRETQNDSIAQRWEAYFQIPALRLKRVFRERKMHQVSSGSPMVCLVLLICLHMR